MQRPGWNPTRRNRNIGTAKQGYGQDNRMVIPSTWRDVRAFWERLPRFTVVTRPVHGRDLPFVVEPTRADCVYACTVDDMAALLNAAPGGDVFGVKGVILRQPKRKEELLSPVWGRLGYAAEVGPISGPAIVVEACPVPLTLKWSRSLDPPRQEELVRLLQEADRVESTRRHHVLHFGPDEVRAVQLYRTILHELGHWVDYLDKVEVPSRAPDGESWDELWAAYRARPESEQESRAHRCAEVIAQQLKSRGHIPFERILDPRALQAEGLSMADFVWPPGPDALR